MPKLIKYTFSVPFLVLYAILFAELFLRLLAPQAFIPRHVTASEMGIRVNLPDTSYVHVTPEVTAEIRINAQGMRADRVFAKNKPEGTVRIALFGDSYFMGYEAALPDTIAGRLEAGLAARGCRAEVLNFAVSGYGTAEMLRMLEGRGLDFNPDIVLFQWHHTDIDDNIRSGLYRAGPEGLSPTGKDYLPAVGARESLARNSVYRFISGHSHLFIIAREKGAIVIKKLLVKARTGLDRFRTPVLDQPPMTDGALLSAALLAVAETQSRKSGADFYVVDIPSRHSRTEFSSSFRLLPESPRPANYISPLAAFEEAADRRVLIYREKGHNHLTPLGNGLVSETVIETLAEQNAGIADCLEAVSTKPLERDA